MHTGGHSHAWRPACGCRFVNNKFVAGPPGIRFYAGELEGEEEGEGRGMERGRKHRGGDGMWQDGVESAPHPSRAVRAPPVGPDLLLLPPPPCEMQTLRMLCAGAPLVATDTGHRYGEEEGKGDAWVCAAEGWLGPWECIRSRLCLVCWASEGIM